METRQLSFSSEFFSQVQNTSRSSAAHCKKMPVCAICSALSLSAFLDSPIAPENGLKIRTGVSLKKLWMEHQRAICTSSHEEFVGRTQYPTGKAPLYIHLDLDGRYVELFTFICSHSSVHIHLFTFICSHSSVHIHLACACVHVYTVLSEISAEALSTFAPVDLRFLL